MTDPMRVTCGQTPGTWLNLIDNLEVPNTYTTFDMQEINVIFNESRNAHHFEQDLAEALPFFTMASEEVSLSILVECLNDITGPWDTEVSYARPLHDADGVDEAQDQSLPYFLLSVGEADWRHSIDHAKALREGRYVLANTEESAKLNRRFAARGNLRAK
jgi:hypothetical protein